MKFSLPLGVGRLACLSILAVITMALVACGAGPGAKAQPEPKKIGDFEFAQGETVRKIPLVDKFSGEGLTYTAKSSDTAVATVEVDNAEDILTVTAVGEGKATITVTAADSQDRTASQTFKVTVPKPTTSEPEPGAPTVRAGAPDSVDVDQGETKTVTLSRVFEGEELTYSAPESDDPDVAIASISNGILIIRAGDPGEATITVTATNDDGNAEYEITVTVPEPEEDGTGGDEDDEATSSSCRFPQTTKLTIKRTESVKCTLLEGYTLELPPGNVLSDDQRPDGETENVWLIRALRKGTHTITVFNAAQIRAGTITVIIPNTSPVRIAGSHPTVPSISSANPTPAVDIRSFFTDEDTEDHTDAVNNLRYRVQSKPDWVLVESRSDGFVSTSASGHITLEILRPMGKEGEEKSFTISIYAVDSSGDESDRPVRLEISLTDGGSISPRARTYTAQQLSNGALHIDNVLEIGSVFLRDSDNIYHTLTFTKAEGKNGLAFSYNYVEGLINENKLQGTTADITAGTDEIAVYKDRDNKNQIKGGDVPSFDSDTALGTDYYLLESGGVVKARWADSPILNENPKIVFKLTGKGSGTIKISYYVAALGSGYTGDDFPAMGGRKATAPGKTLNLRVVTCESPPDEIRDCPGDPT